MELMTVLFVIAITFIIFLVMREIMCWYFKINEILPILRSIDRSLKRLGGRTDNVISDSKVNTANQNNMGQIQAREIYGREKMFRFVVIIIALAAIILVAVYFK